LGKDWLSWTRIRTKINIPGVTILGVGLARIRDEVRLGPEISFQIITAYSAARAPAARPMCYPSVGLVLIQRDNE